MRIWDLHPGRLCRQHLLGEHRELHALWTVLNKNSGGYINHPETRRWKGKRRALYIRHGELAQEMISRGYRHLSPLDKDLADGKDRQDVFLQSPRQQLAILKKKGCNCMTWGKELNEKTDNPE